MQRNFIQAPWALGGDPNAFRASILLPKIVLVHIKSETALARIADDVSLMPVSWIVVSSVLVCHGFMLAGTVGLVSHLSTCLRERPVCASEQLAED